MDIKNLKGEKPTLSYYLQINNDDVILQNLNDEITDLNGKISNLNEKIHNLEEEIAEKDKKIQALSPEIINVGKYVISKAKNDENYFNLKETDGQIILTSQMYSSESACFNGIESVRNNCSDDSKYERKQSVNNKPYFVLKAANGQVIGNSAMYESEEGMENGIASVKKNGISTTVIEE